MTNSENIMNIRTPRSDSNQGSAPASPVKGNPPAASTRDTSPSSASGDTVTITNDAAQMLKLEQSLADIPDIDSSRVAAIKASIAEGSYRVDPEKIVDSLLNIEQDSV